MMDKSTKFRRRIDYTRVFVIILANQELLMVFQVDVGRPSLFHVEYKWIPICYLVCKVLGMPPLSVL